MEIASKEVEDYIRNHGDYAMIYKSADKYYLQMEYYDKGPTPPLNTAHALPFDSAGKAYGATEGYRIKYGVHFGSEVLKEFFGW